MILRALAILSLIVGGEAFSSTPARAAAPVFTEKPCPADWPTDVRKTTCGTLTVDEARGTASDRRIEVAVVVLKASQPFTDASGRALPPVFMFHGGPGGALTPGPP